MIRDNEDNKHHARKGHFGVGGRGRKEKPLGDKEHLFEFFQRKIVEQIKNRNAI